MAQNTQADTMVGATTQQSAHEPIHIIYRWAIGLAVVVLVAIFSLLIWGSGMEFPTTLSYETSSDGSVRLEKTIRSESSRTIDDAVDWMTIEGAWLFNWIRNAVNFALVRIEGALKWTPWPALVVALALLSLMVGGRNLLVFTCIALSFMGFMDLWDNTIGTVALMIVAVVVAVSIGFPLGILGARSQMADNLMRPILDGMQTMPSFVYLLPGILFFGLGKPAGIFATIIYAVPPVIRLTNLGIRQVSPQALEVARAYGASPRQVLAKVQIPMALPTIMAGINQTTMMALAMVTIASLVAAGGLGDDVNRALQKNQPGNGLIAGLAIVFLAIIIDRFTQSVARGRQEVLRRAAG